MDDPKAGELRRLGDLLGDTYAELAGDVEGRGVDDHSAATDTAADLSAQDRGTFVRPVEPERMLALLWPEIVGPEVAANTQPVQLRRGRLVVSASSSAWAQTLQFMGPAIKAGIDRRVGTDVVHEVVFRHAGWRERPRDRTTTRAQTKDPAPSDVSGRSPASRTTLSPVTPDAGGALTAEQRAALARVEALDMEPELRERIVRAMKAAFVRGEQDSVR